VGSDAFSVCQQPGVSKVGLFVCVCVLGVNVTNTGINRGG